MRLHCHWDPLCRVRHGISHFVVPCCCSEVSAGEYLGLQSKDAEHEDNHWRQDVRMENTPESQSTPTAERSGSYLDGVVELLQRTSRALPAADVHPEGIPPHDWGEKVKFIRK